MSGRLYLGNQLVQPGIFNVDDLEETAAYEVINGVARRRTGHLDLSSIKSVDSGVFENMFYYCTGITSVDLSSLESIPSRGLGRAFTYCTGLTDVYFNSLKTTSFGNYNNQFLQMLTYTGTEVMHTLHFPSNLESTIQGLGGYPNFGGTSGYVTLSFDLPPTS